MSLVAMKWMMNQAYRSGLRFTKSDQEFYATHGNVHDKLYDSRAGLAVYYRFKPRDIHAMCHDKGVAAKIHESVLDRIVAMSNGYAPGNMPNNIHFAPVSTPSPRLKRAEKLIKEALGQHSSALDRVRHWIVVRKWAHFIFLLFTGSALYYTFRADGTVAGAAMSLMQDIAQPDFMSVLVSKAWQLLKNWPLGVLIIVAMYGLGRFLRWRMHVNYSRFWYPLVLRLQTS